MTPAQLGAIPGINKLPGDARAWWADDQGNLWAIGYSGDQMVKAHMGRSAALLSQSSDRTRPEQTATG